MNGVDVSGLQVGDILELPDDRAQMMIEHGWAVLVRPAPVPGALSKTVIPD